MDEGVGWAGDEALCGVRKGMWLFPGELGSLYCFETW